MNKLTLVAILASTVLFSCNSEEPSSRPITDSEKTEATAPEVNAVPDKFDPARSSASEPATPTTSISFKEYAHDFGTIDEGDVEIHIFEFTNTGDEPLILDKCKGSCGCTVPQCPKEPIAPGATGTIEVKFNSKGKKNKQTKKVTVTANTDPGQTILTIIAQVTPAPAEGEGDNPMLAK
jgi:hypothetical protein|tara:strand:+ start:272 stop:808 length:537 start_codon:yes stop_codon:yes gene_type:complete